MLDVCWTFARACKHPLRPIAFPLVSQRQATKQNLGLNFTLALKFNFLKVFFIAKRLL